MDAVLVGGDYKGAAMLAEKRLGLKPSPDGALPSLTEAKGSVLNHLEAAEAWRMAGETPRSLAHYDFAEQALQSVELQGLASQGVKQVGATLLNDSLLDYKPSPAEAVLVNYYKAISFWHEGDIENTRVELNRAEDRIRRSVERYEKEIAAAQAENQGKAGSDNKTLSQVEAKMGMAQWQPYDGFVMPQATYLHALFLATSDAPSDRESAITLLQRVAGLEPDNAVIASDIRNLKKGNICPTNDCVWFIQDEGSGPVLEELRMDIPIVTTSGLISVSFAIPQLVSRQAAGANFIGINSGSTLVQEYTLSNMDRVVQSEFKKRMPATVTRAVVGATARAIAQHELNKQAGAFGQLAGLVGNILLTSADVRSWRSTPGITQLAHIRKNGNPVTLSSGGWSETIDLPAKGSQIVYVKQPAAGSPALVSILHINRNEAAAFAQARRAARDAQMATAAEPATPAESALPPTASAQPARETYAQPAREAPPQSVREAYAQPAREAPPQPVQEARPSPVQEAYAQPASEPVREAYAQPAREASLAPVQEEFPPSVQEAFAMPAPAVTREAPAEPVANDEGTSIDKFFSRNRR